MSINNMKVPVPDHNRLILTAMGRESEEFNELDESDRARVEVVIDSDLFVVETLRAVSIQTEKHVSPLHLVFLGTTTARVAGRFPSVILTDAPEPVMIRRKSWGLTRYCKYMNVDGRFTLFSEEVPPDGSGGFRGIALTPVDFAADDWEIIKNDNMKEVVESFSPDNLSPEDQETISQWYEKKKMSEQMIEMRDRAIDDHRAGRTVEFREMGE